jgi:hypothetical protein
LKEVINVLRIFLEDAEFLTSIIYSRKDGYVLIEGIFSEEAFKNQKVQEIGLYHGGDNYAEISSDCKRGYVVKIDASTEEAIPLWDDCIHYLFSPEKVFWRMAISDCSDEELLRKRDEILKQRPGLSEYINTILKNHRSSLLKGIFILRSDFGDKG